MLMAEGGSQDTIERSQRGYSVRNQGPPNSSPIGPLQWMAKPRWGGVLNSSPTHLVIKLILTSKVEPSPKLLLDLRGNFLRIGGVQEQGATLLTVKRTSTHGEGTHACA
eukprot:scaffold753_cov390-Pavlova_lutheri.AAC.8